jgi:hypothetical protein
MVFKYENVVPWGRSYEEYIRMFNLSEADLGKKILGCGDGPASFNAIMHQNGNKMISLDPIYQFSKDQIKSRISETFDIVISQTKENQDKFNWNIIKSVEELGAVRMAAMEEFLADYNPGKVEGRYVFGELPELPDKIRNTSFDLILCAHFLFLYTNNLSLEFHINSIKAMSQVGREIRIFPVLDVNSQVSTYIEPVKEYMDSIGWIAEEVKVNYEFQKDGNHMLKLIRR